MKFKTIVVACALVFATGFCHVDRTMAAETYNLGVDLAITGAGAGLGPGWSGRPAD